MTVAFSYVSMTLVVLGEWASASPLTLLIRKIVILFTGGVLRADGSAGDERSYAGGKVGDKRAGGAHEKETDASRCVRTTIRLIMRAFSGSTRGAVS